MLGLRPDDFDPDLPQIDFTGLVEAASQGRRAGWEDAALQPGPRRLGRADVAARAVRARPRRRIRS
ncbi:hypothetical protein GCM10009560_14980 [Nonomuraea longicatena]|uniref:Uncharacterized protein n=1 Tax=Nonomuraea longicatena TaxID=83682 RepID=A0ABN1NWZ1_9ACTN